MDKKINILMCCSELSVKGGMVSVVKNYLRYKDWDKYHIIYIPTHTESNKIIVLLYFIFSYIKILLLLFNKNIRLAHLHTAERGSFYRKAILVRTLKVFGIKVIMHHHAAEFEEFYSKLSNQQKKFVNETLKLADVNIVLSKRLVPMITNKAPEAKVKVLYNAVSVYEKNPYNMSASNILFLGRLGRRKGTYDLLDAVKIIDSDIPENVKLYLCGDGEIDNIKVKINELGLQKRIAFIGWIDGKQKAEFMYNTSITVLPSYNEGLPMAILESMAYGIPCISTNIASIPEVIFDNKNGFLIRPGDIEGLAKSLLELINNFDKRKRFSENSYDLITKNFSLDNHVSQLISLYHNLLEES